MDVLTLTKSGHGCTVKGRAVCVMMKLTWPQLIWFSNIIMIIRFKVYND